MDILEPKLVWIEGRCYRFYESDAWSAKDLATTPYVEDSNPDEFRDLADDSCPVDIDIVPFSRSRYKHSFYVPSAFIGFIIGTGGTMRKKLENDTKTAIRVPKLGEDGDVVIIGPTKSSIVSARHRIDLLVENSKKKLRITHFISIPMTDKNIAQNFEQFKSIVINQTGKDARGVHDGIFQKAEKMHITMGVMVLVDDEEIKAAVEALKECGEQIIKPFVREHGPVIITAQGLECFNDDPSEVNVIFGKLSTDNNVLQELAENMAEYFVQKGLMDKEEKKINLHMTVMNRSFMIGKEKNRREPVDNFDATNILKVHKEYFFGETILNKIQLCQRGEYEADGYYKIAAEINVID